MGTNFAQKDFYLYLNWLSSNKFQVLFSSVKIKNSSSCDETLSVQIMQSIVHKICE